VEFTDHLDGAAIRPKDAFFVRASDVNPCLRHDAALTADKQPLHTHFDRCAPSILAFRDESAARGFAEQHGGQFLRFGELAPMFQR
jgi:hypothetical protein